MATMCETAVTTLRQELKAWEKTFAATHEGRKAGREDIKSDASIAAKYREYDKLRRRGSQKQNSQSQPTSFLAAPESQEHNPTLPSVPTLATPSRRKASQTEVQIHHSPVREPSPTPQAIRLRLGPTPQKDGQILGLFESPYSNTPSKPRDPLCSINGNVTATPSKSRDGTITESPAAEKARLSRTPQSSGKRYMLDAFATPIKRKRDDVACTPSSGRGNMATPAFLRRSTTDFMAELDALEEDEEVAALRRREPPFKKRGLARSLSAIIRNLRDQEEEKHDEELDMLREMEAEAEGGLDSQPRVQRSVQTRQPEVMVEDSQVVMPLGPDQGPESEEDEEIPGDGLDQHGNPRKVWKKKGLKRQTKRVISEYTYGECLQRMLILPVRPVKHKPVATEERPDDNDKEEEGVLETQLPDNSADVHDEDASGSEFSEGENSDFDDSAPKQKKKVVRPRIDVAPTTVPTNPTKPDDTNPIKKAARKISATAHANFRKLKIKNKNSKANGRGRFGRR